MFRIDLPPVVKNILILNILVFLVHNILGMPFTEWFFLYNFDYVDPYTFKEYGFEPFQLVTHMFMHGGFAHIFFNMFGLVMFGKIIETVWGGKRFFILYFISGLGAAGLQLLAFNIYGIDTRMIGASGAIFGILAAFAMLFPNVELMLIFLPVPIKAKYMVPGFAVLSLVFGVTGISGSIAHFAHLGGAIFGFLIAWYWKKNQFRIH